MVNKVVITGVLFASLACTTFVSAQSVRDKAVKAAYQGPEAKFLKIGGKAFNVKKAKVKQGPGTRIVNGQVSYVKLFPFNSGRKVSYTLVFRRNGTLLDVSMQGAKSSGVFNAISKKKSTKGLIDGSWEGSVRYLIAEIGRAVPKDLVGIPIPPGPIFPKPEPPPVVDGMDDDEGGNDPSPQSYFFGVSTSVVKVPSGHGHQHSKGQQRFSGDSYGHRINSVVPGSPAKSAGLEPGDIIISANQKSLTQQDSLSKAVAESNGQLDLILRNVRNGQSIAVVVKLDGQTSTVKRREARRGR
jgi:hypothetical protein